MDINFFSESIKAIKRARKHHAVIAAALLAAVLVLAGIYEWTEFTLSTIRKDVSLVNQYMDSKDVKIRQQELSEKLEKLTVINRYAETVEAIDSDINRRNVISASTLKDLNGTLPANCYISDLEYRDTRLVISGFSGEADSIAELLHNLSALGWMDEVTLASIGESDTKKRAVGEIGFEIDCLLKGGGMR